jgi:hypothetical protein
MKYYGIQNEVKSYINRLQSEQGITVSLSAIKSINDRVESLKKSGDWSRFSLGFNDVDGDAYLARAGVIDPIGRCEVLWFTRGMKALNLWNNTVCWPMRNYQNIGTGATVFSLGGFASNSGTLVNSPGWSNDGITSTAIGQCMTSTLPLLGILTTIASYKVNVDPGASRRIISTSSGGSWFGTNMVGSGELFGTNGSVTFGFGTGLAINTQTFDAAIFGSSTTGFRNKTIGTTTTGLFPAAGDGNIGLFRPNTTFINATVSLMIAANSQLLTSQLALLNDLYKLTLGNGLGLP